jgi:hypothetical protein
VRVPERSETIVRIPVENGIKGAEGIVEKMEIAKGIYLASSLIMVTNGQAITSILNTNEKDVVIKIPEIKWENYKMQEEEFPSLVGSLITTQGSVWSRAQEVKSIKV